MNRTETRRVRLDADWEIDQPEGNIRIRLLQAGYGATALYGLRVEDPRSEWTDYYNYACASGELTQRTKASHTPQTQPLLWPDAAPALHQILQEALKSE